jgi:hypothetical protein
MRQKTFLALAALLMLALLASTACRALEGQHFVVYLNENNTDRMVALEAGPRPLRQWWEGQPKDPRSEGRYVHGAGARRTAGTYWSEANVYVLKAEPGTGKDLRFTIQPDLSLGDENGDIWRRAPERDVRIAKKP